MPGFIRRFGFFPGIATITQIEGVVIVDLPPPGSVEGVGTGVAALVGEFPDMTHAVDVDGSGIVTTDIVPQEIFSTKDLLDKTGGFDPTIGDFGNSGGNGFVAIRNKRYSRLIVAPINLTSAQGCRYTRDLPLNESATSALSVIPVQGATIDAGREFRNLTGGRVLIGQRVDFSAFEPFLANIAGITVAGVSAVTQTFIAGAAAEQVWQVDDDTGPTFVDMTSEFNSAATADLVPFPAVEATDDNFSIGMDVQFGQITLDNLAGTAGVGGIVVWEYFNGSAFVALSGVVDGTTSFTAAVAAGQVVTWTIPVDWATTSLGGVTKFYVRAKITTIYTTNPIYDSGFLEGIPWSVAARLDGDLGIKQGDIIVIGNNNGGLPQPTAEAGTYRVESDPTAGSTELTIEKLDGSAFVFTLNNAVPFRIHISTDADSAPAVVLGSTGAGGYSAADAGGSSTASRPLTDAVGVATDGTYPLGENLIPIEVPPAVTGDTADPLSGLTGRTHTVTPLAYTNAVQGLNAPSVAAIDTAYSTALDSLISDLTPVASINMVWSARTSLNIRNLIRQHVGTASNVSLGRMGVIRPELTVQTTTAVVSATDPGVGANRSERIVYAWPGAKMFVPEAVGTRLKLANGLTTFEGTLDTGWDSFVVSLMSNLRPELNIGQAARPVPRLLSPIRGVQNGVSKLEITNYITLKARGVAALRIDRTVGPILQSGITSSLLPGERNISRRRMADFIQDSLAARLVLFTKLPLTTANKDNAVAEVNAFMEELLSIDSAASQRISEFLVDDKSGNTPELEAKGIFAIIVKARTLASADFIVVQTEVGEGVDTAA